MRRTSKAWAAVCATLCAVALLVATPAAAETGPEQGNTTVETPPVQAASATCPFKSGTYTNFTTPQGPRKFKAYFPPGATSDTPMIVSLHGATGSSEVAEAETGWTPIAQREKWIVIYPQSTGTPPSTVWGAGPNSADSQYVAQLTEYMHIFGCSNPTDTHLNGFSMGAMVTSRLMCTHSHLFASAAMVGGALPPTPGCTIPPSKTVIVVHGADDTTVPFDGSMPPNLQFLAGGAAISHYPGLSRAEMAGEWLAAKGCGTILNLQKPGGVWVNDYTMCRAATTIAYTYLYTGHTWNPNPNLVAAKPTSELIFSHLAPDVPFAHPVPAGGTIKIPTGKPNQVVFGNLTVTNAAKNGYTTAYTCGQARPVVSTNNYESGRSIPNFAAVKTDATGHFCVYTTSMADIIWDQVGSDNGTKMKPVGPIRSLDTRIGTYMTYSRPTVGKKTAPATATSTSGPLPTNKVVRVQTGQPSTIVAGNLTVVSPGGDGHTTAWPCDTPRPLASVNNYRTGVTIPNYVAVKTSSTGEFCVQSSSPAHILFDLAATTPTASIGTATRLADTRDLGWRRVATPNVGQMVSAYSTPVRAGTPVFSGETIRISTGMPNSTVAVNATVVTAAGIGHTTVWPCDSPKPLASTNNYHHGQTIPVFAAVSTGPSGDICVAVVGGSTHFVMDKYGTLPVPTASPSRNVDSRESWEPWTSPAPRVG